MQYFGSINNMNLKLTQDGRLNSETNKMTVTFLKPTKMAVSILKPTKMAVSILKPTKMAVSILKPR